eukprot:251732_1
MPFAFVATICLCRSNAIVIQSQKSKKLNLLKQCQCETLVRYLMEISNSCHLLFISFQNDRLMSHISHPLFTQRTQLSHIFCAMRTSITNYGFTAYDRYLRCLMNKQRKNVAVRTDIPIPTNPKDWKAFWCISNACHLLNILNHPKIIKKLLKDATIWKPIFDVLMLYLSPNRPRILGVANNNDSHILHSLWSFIIHASCYWKFKHLNYLNNKGFERAARSGEVFKSVLPFGKTLFQHSSHHRGKMPHRHCGVLYMNLQAMEMKKRLKFSPLVVTDEEVWDGYKEKQMKCGYLYCNKNAFNCDFMRICSGCKMIYYCSRRHQKMHWNLIHSKQCIPH